MSDVFELQSDLYRSESQRQGRYWGFVSGTVTTVEDNLGLVRIKARIGGQGDNEESEYLIPAFPGSMECKPVRGDPCIVGYIDGDPHRGFWLYHPKSTTNGRPTQAMVLGTTAWGMINYLVDQFNQLRSDFNAHGHSPGTFATATGPVTGVCAAAGSVAASLVPGNIPTIPGQGTTASSANKGQASDGSTVPNVSTSSKVLSGLIRVR